MVVHNRPADRVPGFVLVIVLWLIALLTIMAMGLAYTSRQSVRSMGGLVAGSQARYLAEGGVQLVLMNLLSRQAEDRLLGDGEIVIMDLPGGVVEIVVNDESGKIDINTASSELLARLFASFDLPQEEADALADAVVDYRDEDHLLGLNGAEDEQYFSAGLSWEAKDSAFTHVDELQQVYGMPLWLFNAVVSHVTIYSRSKGINPQVAPLSVLLALSDEPPTILESYIEQRRENHLAGLALPPPPVIDSQFLSRARGGTFTITALGKTPSNHQSAITTTVRLKRDMGRETIETLSWMPSRLHALDVRGERDSLPAENELK